MTRGRYRWRTTLRAHTPWWLIERGAFSKGRRDCGDHDFYNEDGVVEHCFHCRVGERPHDPAHFPARDDDGPRRAR